MIIEDLIKSSNLRIKIKNKSVHRLRTSLGTKINKNKTARQVLRLNILYSRRQLWLNQYLQGPQLWSLCSVYH